MGSIGSALGRFVRSLGLGDTAAKIIGLLIFVAIIGWIIWTIRREKKDIDSGTFKSFNLPGETGVLHIAPQKYAIPGSSLNISKLRGFNTAEEIYHYVYKEFDEAIFQKLVIHTSDTEIVEFIRDDSQPDDENQQLLAAVLPKSS